MAKGDIGIFNQVDGGTTAYPITTGQTFEDGEVVFVAEAGTLSEAADDPAVVAGISMGSSLGRTVGVPGHNSETVADGTMIAIYKPVSGQTFKTENLRVSSAVTVPTLAHVGDTAGFDKFANGTRWGIDTAKANTHVEIIDVLDSNGQSLGSANERTVGTGVTVVFGFI